MSNTATTSATTPATTMKNTIAPNLAMPVANLAMPVALLALLVLFALLLCLMHQPNPLPIASTSQTTAEERAATLSELRAKENAAATTYAWIDRQNGTVRLPLPRAIELTIQDLNP
jgi:hypothetical protein